MAGLGSWLSNLWIKKQTLKLLGYKYAGRVESFWSSFMQELQYKQTHTLSQGHTQYFYLDIILRAFH